MKQLVGKFLAQIHVIIIAYSAYSFYGEYISHEEQLAMITDQAPGLEQEIQQAQKKLDEIKKFREDIEQSKEKVNQVFANIERVQKQLPSEISDIEVLDYFTKEARGLNIPEIEPNPLQEQPLGFYVSKPYKISGRGTFLQFLIYLERINASERLYNVKNLSLVADKEPQKSRFQVINMNTMIDTFKFNSSHKETSGVDEIVEVPEEAEGGPKKRKRK
jgi:Tfp pilus assembly protein PilO